MNRNLVVCLDGTHNEADTGLTNVVRLYDMTVKDASQLVYYDPGVGTMGARSAITRAGQTWTQAAGLVVGYGIKDNIQEAYHWLMENFRAGDQLWLFGFSRGAYTALALAGMLRTVGLLRPGADNLIPYALKLYARHGKGVQTKAEDNDFWNVRSEFGRQFGNPEFPGRFAPQVRFLGLWDTVKSVGWLSARARFEQARWPFTRRIPNVTNARLALAIDESRRPYGEYRFDPREVARRPGLQEMWFAGVHSDVGGYFEDNHKLSDIALAWVAGEAIALGLRVDAAAYQRLLGVPPGASLPASPSGQVHENSAWWGLLGWHHRRILPGDQIHPSVCELVAASAEPGLTAQPHAHAGGA
jgi:uncharacterized protein (DUF2235 family)